MYRPVLRGVLARPRTTVVAAGLAGQTEREGVGEGARGGRRPALGGGGPEEGDHRAAHRRGEVAMEPGVLAAMHHLRDFMFERVYLRPESRRQAEKAIRLLRNLVDYFLENPDEMPESYRHRNEPLVTQVIDVVAGMSDRYALRAHDRLVARLASSRRSEPTASTPARPTARPTHPLSAQCPTRRDRSAKGLRFGPQLRKLMQNNCSRREPS